MILSASDIVCPQVTSFAIQMNSSDFIGLPSKLIELLKDPFVLPSDLQVTSLVTSSELIRCSSDIFGLYGYLIEYQSEFIGP